VAQRVLGLAAAYGPARLERACARAEHFGTADYPTLKRILAGGFDRESVAINMATGGGANRPFTFVRQASEFAAGVLAAAVGGTR
jgi:hypothetical protein